MANTEETNNPTVKSLAKELDQLRVQLQQQSALSNQLLEIQEENLGLKERLRRQELELQAIRVQAMNSEQRIEAARKVLDAIEAERAKGGANKWLITNSRWKNRQGEPAGHVFYSDATEPRAAVSDFKNRAGVQWDSTEGSDPFGAELISIVGKDE